MSLTTVSFTGQQAPCGQIVDGEQRQDRDDECVLTDDRTYACGCRSIRHEYHDGSFSRKVVHHDGTVLVDELLGAEWSAGLGSRKRQSWCRRVPGEKP